MPSNTRTGFTPDDLATLPRPVLEQMRRDIDAILTRPTPALDHIDWDDDEEETPAVSASRAKTFQSGRCRVCGHLEGDHESFGDGTFTCDDDCDEDLNGYCHPGRL